MPTLHPRLTRRAIGLSVLITLTAAFTAAPAHAELVAYDGFIAGGATPNAAAGEYESGTGYPDSHLDGQAPTTLGFDAAAWDSASAFADWVYYAATAEQLVYQDAGNRRLLTSHGQVTLARTSGSSDTDKEMSRGLDIGTSLPDTMYMSMLVQVSEGAELTVRSGSTDGSTVRRFNFGIDANGNPFATTTDTSPVGTMKETNTEMVVDPSRAHLLVVKLTNDGFDSDQLDLFIDPDLAAEALNLAAVTVDFGDFYVGGNAAWTLADIFFRNVVAETGQFIVMDEVRIGTTWADVTPHVQVPEPTTAALGVIGLVGLAARRRRRVAD